MKLFIRDLAWIRKGEGWAVWRITLYRTEETYHNFLGIVEYVTDKMENIYTDQSRTT